MSGKDDENKGPKFSTIFRERIAEVEEKLRVMDDENKSPKWKAVQKLHAELMKKISLTELDAALDALPRIKIHVWRLVLRIFFLSLIASLESKDYPVEVQRIEQQKIRHLSALIHNPQLNSKDLHIISEISNIFSTKDSLSFEQIIDMAVQKVNKWFLTESDKNAGCITYAKLKEQIGHIGSSMCFTPTALKSIGNPYNDDFNSTLAEHITEKVNGAKSGKDKEAEKTKKFNIIEFVEFDKYKKSRLTKKARDIIRGIVNRVKELHGTGNSFLKFELDNILISEEGEIKLTGLTLRPLISGPEEDPYIYADFKKLKSVIKNYVLTNDVHHDEFPEDLSHFLNLLSQRQVKRKEINIYDHSCMWSPHERIKFVFLFAALFDRTRKEIADLKLTPDASLNARSEWHKRLKDSVYSPITVGAEVSNEFRYLIKMKNAFEHFRESANKQSQSLLKTESDLFVVYPDYIAKLMVYTARLKHTWVYEF